MGYDIHEYIGGGFDERVGEVVVGMVQLGLFLARTDAEHGTGEELQVVGKIFRPAERGEDVTLSTGAVLFDKFHQCGIVLGGEEWVS